MLKKQAKLTYLLKTFIDIKIHNLGILTVLFSLNFKLNYSLKLSVLIVLKMIEIKNPCEKVNLDHLTFTQLSVLTGVFRNK